jgi:hypothetical protein
LDSWSLVDGLQGPTTRRDTTFLGTIDTGSSIATNAGIVGEYGRRRGMAVTFLKGLNVDNLSTTEKARLKKSLLDHKKALNRTSKIIDGHLKKLASKKKKRKAKR